MILFNWGRNLCQNMHVYDQLAARCQYLISWAGNCVQNCVHDVMLHLTISRVSPRTDPRSMTDVYVSGLALLQNRQFSCDERMRTEG